MQIDRPLSVASARKPTVQADRDGEGKAPPSKQQRSSKLKDGERTARKRDRTGPCPHASTLPATAAATRPRRPGRFTPSTRPQRVPERRRGSLARRCSVEA